MTTLQNLIQYDFDLSWQLSVMCWLDKESVLFKLLDNILHVFEVLGSGIPSLTISILAIPFYPQWFWFLVNFSVAHLFDVFCQFSLKNYFKRPRPKYQDNNNMFFTHGPDKYSFPSGHCARMAMFWYLTTCVLDMNLYSFYYQCASVFYTIVIGSRVLMGRHFVSDLIGGTLLGLAEGYMMWYWIWRH